MFLHLVRVFDHPQSNKVFPCVQMEFPVLQFVPLAPCPVSGHYGEESGPFFFIPSHQVNIGEIPPSLLFSRLKSSSSCSLSSCEKMLWSLNHLCGPVLGSSCKVTLEEATRSLRSGWTDAEDVLKCVSAQGDEVVVRERFPSA